MCGKPVSGSLTYGAAGPKAQAIVVECPTYCQPRGDQSRRVIGELVKASSGGGESAKASDFTPKLSFAFNAFGPRKNEDLKVPDGKGQMVERELESYDVKATLELGGRKLDVNARCAMKYGKVVEKSIEKVTINTYFTVKGKDLGLSGPLTNEEIDFRITCQGISGEPPAGGGKRK
jgi:hypothetical protein